MTDRKHTAENFIRTIKKTISEFTMLEHQDSVLAAVSGGPDSIALVLALLGIREEYCLEIGIVHMNHLLRKGAAFKDEAFVKEFAEKFNLPFYSEQMDVSAYAKEKGLSIETAGRKLRYLFFEKTARTYGYSKIATGHHKDDNAEQVLMNLLRGAGTKGLSGIPPVRDNLFIRPMISVSKQQIHHFLTACNQTFMNDETNADPRFLRNKIRHHLIPHLQKEYNPEIIDALNRLSAILRQEEALWQKQTRESLSRCLVKSSQQSMTLSRPLMAELAPAILQRVLRAAILQVKSDLKRISHAHIEDVLKFCMACATGSSLDLPDRIRIYKTRNTIEIKKEQTPLREIGRTKKIQLLKKQEEHMKKS